MLNFNKLRFIVFEIFDNSQLFLTDPRIYDETKFSSCHTPYPNNILHPMSSYYFLSLKELFRAGNHNVNARPDMLYFSLWGVYSKIYQKHNLWPVKTAKPLCTSSKEKGRDLTQSYDKSPYTSRNVKRAKWQHTQRHKKVRLHSGCGLTKDGQLE